MSVENRVKMKQSKYGDSIQLMMFEEDFIDLENGAGAITGKSIILCKEDGSIQLTFVSGNDILTDMVAGDFRALPPESSVTIMTGKFDFAS